MRLAEYAPWQWPQGPPTHQHMVQTLWVGAVLAAIRAVIERVFKPKLHTLLMRLGGKKSAAKTSTVFDNMYIVVWSVLTEVLAVYVTLRVNGGCTPWSTQPCLDGWPHHAVHAAQRWYMVLMFQFYASEMLGSVLGFSMKLKPDMWVHHVATMGLISSAYSLNLSRFGIMWQALFDLSNPILHTAKAMNAAHLPQLETPKWVTFATFAATFFVCRVAAAPFSVVMPALTRSYDVLPQSWATFLIGLMFIVCGMQWLWFYRIIELAKGKDTEKHA